MTHNDIIHELINIETENICDITAIAANHCGERHFQLYTDITTD